MAIHMSENEILLYKCDLLSKFDQLKKIDLYSKKLRYPITGIAANTPYVAN